MTTHCPNQHLSIKTAYLEEEWKIMQQWTKQHPIKIKTLLAGAKYLLQLQNQIHL